MCGIYVCVNGATSSKATALAPPSWDLLKNRGPDAFQIKTFPIGERYTVTVAVSVLHMRGDHCGRQPFMGQQPPNDADWLAFNGEIYDGLEAVSTSYQENDGMMLFRRLQSLSTAAEFQSQIASLRGPCAFVYYQDRSKSLWFARDAFGRRSLLLESTEDVFTLCSVDLTNNGMNEIVAGCLYRLSLGSNKDHSQPFTHLELYPYSTQIDISRVENIEQNLMHPIRCEVIVHSDPVAEKLWLFTLNASEVLESDDVDNSTVVDEFLGRMRISLQRRLNPLPKTCLQCTDSGDCITLGHSRVAILFSGGVDSLLVAALTAEYFTDPTANRLPYSVDLLNVAFVTDLLHSSLSLSSVSLSPNVQFGEDVIAGFPPSDVVSAPDRILGRTAFRSLAFRFGTQIRLSLIEIDVSKEELNICRRERVRHLVAPGYTVLDDSIGCALWFAARGRGRRITVQPLTGEFVQEKVDYCSPAKVLLVGSGADELLGGYARHRTRFRQDGWGGVVNELQMELRRIGQRNLGRDDRVLSDHGRESRLPFLDEDLVDFLNRLPINKKTDLRLPRGIKQRICKQHAGGSIPFQGIGEKRLLRLGLDRLGFGELAWSAKRAIQFGSRIAKLEDGKEKATNTCTRLTELQ